MSMININLLDNRRKEILARQALSAKINLVSIVIVFISVLVAAGVGIFRLQTSQQLEAKEAELTQLESQLVAYTDVFGQIYNVSTKVDAIGEIFATRQLALLKLELFFRLYNSGLLRIRHIGLGGAINPLDFEIGGSVDNVAEFITLNQYIKNVAEEEAFEKVILDTLSRGETGQYSFNYLIRFSSQKPNE